MLRYLFSAFLLVIAEENVESAKILALFPFPSRSHFISFNPLLEELANKGHHMTVVSAFPRKTPLPNYTDLPLENTWEKMGGSSMNFFQLQDTNVVVQMTMFRYMGIEMCEQFLHQPSVQKLINGTNEEYDLIIYEPFLSECAYGLIYNLKTPYIHISANTINKWMGDGVGNPHTYSVIPEMFLGYSTYMTFKERMINAVLQTWWDFERNWIILPKMQALMTKHFNDPSMPSILEIENNSSFLLLNSHVALNYPRSLTPNTAEVGGMHIKGPKGLPQDIKKLLDKATDGVIYFSLGSNVRSADMPESMRNAILRSFSKLNQKILWKWEADSLPGQPKNVHLSKWFPQREILAHSNIKAFITHGGLLSIEEGSYFGIPLVAIPVVFDQVANAKRAAEHGSTIHLDFKNITENSMDWVLKEILTNNRYKEKAKYLANLFRDQPQQPLERAVFWVEYVIRHKGAPHLRSAALSLNFIQYFLLDVIAVILIATITIITLLVTVSKFLIRKCFFKSKPAKYKQKKVE